MLELEKVKILIVEDEFLSLSYLKELINKFFPEFYIVGLCSDLSCAIKTILEGKPNIVFLDISLGIDSGFDILERLSDPKLNIIVTTASEEHAMKAIKYNVVDYILKPINSDEFLTAVKKALKRINELQTSTAPIYPKKLILNSANTVEFFDFDDVVMIMAENVYSILHLQDGQTKLVTKSLGHLEKILPESTFSRVHNSYIINHKYIIKFVKDSNSSLLMKGEFVVPVAKRRKDDFLSKLKIH